MADNIAVTPGTGATIAADDISSVLYQRVKLALGADGTAVDAVAGAGVVGTGVQRVTLASDDTLVATVGSSEYETVAASATDQVLGPTGATGDYIARLIIIPATTSPGNVLILDNATSITVFAGGAVSITELKPIVVELGMKSVSGAWKVTTGTNVSVIAVGNFT